MKPSSPSLKVQRSFDIKFLNLATEDNRLGSESSTPSVLKPETSPVRHSKMSYVMLSPVTCGRALRCVQGKLLKRSRSTGIWQERQFYGWRDAFCWYKPGKKRESGRVEAIAIVGVTEPEKKPLCLIVHCVARLIELKAFTKKDKEMWRSHFQPYIHRHRQNQDCKSISNLRTAVLFPNSKSTLRRHSLASSQQVAVKRDDIPKSPSQRSHDVSLRKMKTARMLRRRSLTKLFNSSGSVALSRLDERIAIPRTDWYSYSAGGRTGDLLLFRTRTLQGGLTRAFTWAEIDHVGLVIRSDSETMILEAIAGNGVIMNTLYDFKMQKWYRQYSTVYLRRLQPPLPPGDAAKLLKFAHDAKGTSYGLLNYITRPVTNGQLEEKGKGKQKFFCSELVASSYQHMGLLPQGISASRYVPGDYCSSFQLRLLGGYRLQNEERICWDGVVQDY